MIINIFFGDLSCGTGESVDAEFDNNLIEWLAEKTLGSIMLNNINI